MSISISQLLEESFQIAWEYLERTGELGDGTAASRFLSDTIEAMIRQGHRSRLALSNRTIGAYQRFLSSGAGISGPRARSSSTYLLPKGKILFQSFFISTTVQPAAGAASSALSSLPTLESRS